MGLIVKAGESMLAPAPPGNHLAICYGCVDCGTQEAEFEGRVTKRRRVRLSWELCHEFRETDGDNIPYVVSKEYTVSLHEKANLRHDLENWRGVPFTEEELQGFDLKNILGKPCLLNVLQKESKRGNMYAYISGISPVIAGLEIPERFHKTVFLSFDETPYNILVFKELPEFLQTLIEESEEWQALNIGNVPNALSASAETEVFTEEVPF